MASGTHFILLLIIEHLDLLPFIILWVWLALFWVRKILVVMMLASAQEI